MSSIVEAPDEVLPEQQAVAVALPPPVAESTAEVLTKPSTSVWFYGWVMLPLAMLLTMGTAPGQTFGITYFNSHFREAFDLTQTGLSSTYLAATLIASLMLPYVGGMIDRFGLRRMAMGASITMALTCVFASQVQGVAMLFGTFVLLRTVGPGTMTLIANNTLAMWFDRRLGMASGIMQVTMACAMAAVPVAFIGLIEHFGWRGAYLALAGFFGFALFPVIALMFRSSPSDVGQFPDGKKTACAKQVELSKTGLNVRQAMRQPAYWILLISASTWALIGTGLIFHVEALFQQEGLSKLDSAQAMQWLAIGMATMQIVGGVLADRFPTRWLLVAAVGMICASCTIMAVGSGHWMTLGFALFGCAQGTKSIVVGTVWPRYFGRLHLGKLRGSALTAAIAGSSLGPLIMGISTDYFGGFTPSIWLFAAWSGAVAVAGIWATPPELKTAE